MDKKIKLADLILMSISTLYGIRWIAKSTASSFGLGLSSIPAWFVFAVLFFIPQALICAELANKYSSKNDGGLYVWVSEALGEKYGFMAAWMNWTSKIFWYASFMTFFIINLSYAIAKPDLANNKTFVLIMSVVTFWILSMLSMNGIGKSKFFTSFGAFGSLIPTIILIVGAYFAVFIMKDLKPVSEYNITTLMPSFSPDSFVAVSGILFGFTGGEVLANFVTELENPKKDYPKAMFISAIVVSGLYVLGSIALTLIMNPNNISASTGILDGITILMNYIGIGKVGVSIVAAGIAFSMLGATIIYIASPVKMLFGSVPKGMFSQKLTKVNKYGVPQNALMMQTIVVTIILVTGALIPEVDSIYNILVTMTALTALFPYILLFISYIKLKRNETELNNKSEIYEVSKNKKICLIIAYEVLALSIIGIIFSCAPVMDTMKDNIIYEIEMIGGGIVIILTGMAIWKNYQKKREKK